MGYHLLGLKTGQHYLPRLIHPLRPDPQTLWQRKLMEAMRNANRMLPPATAKEPMLKASACNEAAFKAAGKDGALSTSGKLDTFERVAKAEAPAASK